ncbi:cell division protein ZapC domain-containing protein [Rheinheimera maricola]|uniref:Cell division protein ZapC n=1 Tax=Rheinheimera maricola TaxID=2793282 RepID=A0ABS7X5D6_9GAMM|nr:cell division protein ZapC domain-containing protein [Rheinheimera maricola]MBZ9610750.1 cell division protein ZapC [Rheinheimera maricola]
MFTPSEQWIWHYCSEKARLLLDITATAQFCSPFSAAQLVYQPHQQPLTMAEAETFWAIDHSLQQLDMPAAVRLELCLTALCGSFLQQQAHKSWYFQQGSANTVAAQYDVVMLRGLSSQYALVLSADSDCANCLLLGDISTLAGKNIARLQVVRVLHNRVSALNVSIPYRYSA